MDTKYIDLIDRLTTAAGASGFEDDVVNVARDYCKDFAPTRENSLRNLYIGRTANTGKLPVVMLDAHSDEVGFMVRAINPNGTLSFIELGGIRRENHQGQRVKVRTTAGNYIPGLISCRPPHFAKDSSAEVQLVIDIGATCAQEAEKMGIRVGAPCVPDAPFHYDAENDLIFAKAMDCRIGCAALIATMEQLQNENLQVDVEGALTSQEEIGDRGALVAARTLQPKAAIVFEGAPADDTYAAPHEIQCGVKKGAMLRLIDNSMVTNPRFVNFATALAEKEGIPFQIAVRSGGGTNGGCIHIVGDSIPVIVISVPVRYIHSPNGIASYEDFDNVVKLAVTILKNLTGDIIDSF